MEGAAPPDADAPTAAAPPAPAAASPPAPAAVADPVTPTPAGTVAVTPAPGAVAVTPAPGAIAVTPAPGAVAAATAAPPPSSVVAVAPAAPPALLPSVEVRYTDLSLHVTISAAASARTMTTVFETLYGAATAAPRAVVRAVTRSAPPPPRTIKVLDGCSGVLRPGTMTLLLGHPGCGKSTLLKALTGRLTNAHALVGDVAYGGLDRAGLLQRGMHLGQLVQYVSQLDEHFPFLTVRDTLSFVAANAVAGADEGAVRERVGDVTSLLHLGGCIDTIIGNELARGVSGGEKKRVTVGEGIITAARFLALDEISTGLDSSVTYDVVRSLRARARDQGLGVVIALLQPTPETYALFDDVILMREGAVVYHGARAALPGYLTGLGFLLPDQSVERHASSETAEDIADYLAELMTFPARRHAKDVARVAAAAAAAAPSVGLPLSPSSGALADAAAPKAAAPEAASKGAPPALTTDDAPLPPLTTEAFAAAWAAAPLRTVNLGGKEDAPPLLTLASPAAVAQYGHAYVHSAYFHAQSVFARQCRLLAANSLFMFVRIFSAFFMAIVFGALYYQGGVFDGLNKYGLFLNCVMQLLFTNISEMSGAVEGKYIGYRQVANGVHPAWTFPLASILAHIPLAIAESLCFGCVAYFMAGLTYDAGRFFFFTLVIFLIDVFAATLFRTFAFAAPSLVAAQAGPMPIIALIIMFCGFMVLKSKMGWLEFVYWVNPAAWAIGSLAQNEFFAERYAFIPPTTNTSIPAYANLTLGELNLVFFDQSLDPAYKWAGVGFVIGMIMFVAFFSFWAFANIRYDRNMGSARMLDDGATALGGETKRALGVTTRTLGETKRTLGSTSNALGGLAPSGSSSEKNLNLGASASAQQLALQVTPEVVAPVTASSVLPFTPLALAWKDISYTVALSKQAGGGHKQLLQGISGYAMPGRLIALMGASGAGKTTLLDVLGGRKNTGTMTGAIYLNGFPKDGRTFNRSAAYCEQVDLHMPLTTVREALDFSAALRLPSSVTAEQRGAFIDEILGLLELQNLADAKVGSVGSPDGLAPGERKRLTIGVELAANAPILFLDEPTSGLDARAAAVVVRVIRNVAHTGRTILCTVHQPSTEVFSQFDDLLLLQRGGWQVYFGPIGRRAHTLLSYLQGLPGASPCPRGFNPASYMLDQLAGTDSSGVGDDSEPAKGAAPGGGSAPATRKAVLEGAAYQASLFASPGWTTVAAPQLAKLCSPLPGVAPVVYASAQARSFVHQLGVLIPRTWRMYNRNIPMNIGRIVAILFLCTLFGTIYFNLNDKASDYQGTRTLIAAIFMTAAFSAMLNMDASLPTLISNRSTFYRENSSLMYTSNAYALSNFIVEMPWLAGIVLAGTSIGYFMIGLSPNASIFFTHYFCTYILALVLVSFGNSVAATLPSFDTAQAAVGILAPILFLFGGMFSKPSSMPPGAKWLNTIDPIAYAFRALIPLHFCAAPACYDPTIIAPSWLSEEVGVFQPYPRSVWVDNTYEVSSAQIWPCIGYLSIFVGVFQLIAFTGTNFVRHISR